MNASENQKVPKSLFSNFLLPVFFCKIEFIKFETRFVCEAYDLKLLLISLKLPEMSKLQLRLGPELFKNKKGCRGKKLVTFSKPFKFGSNNFLL